MRDINKRKYIFENINEDNFERYIQNCIINEKSKTIDFSFLMLYKIYLKGANLKNAIFKEANLKGADFIGANLTSINLEGADLSGARLRAANMTEANLKYTIFRGADLKEVDFRGADLKGAKFSNAQLDNSIWLKSDIKAIRFEIKKANFKKIIIEEFNVLKEVYRKNI